MSGLEKVVDPDHGEKLLIKNGWLRVGQRLASEKGVS
jgi:hypothetical protein